MRYIKTNFNCMAKLSEQMEYQHEESSACTWCTPMYMHNKWMNEWMFNDTSARKTNRLLGVRQMVSRAYKTPMTSE